MNGLYVIRVRILISFFLPDGIQQFGVISFGTRTSFKGVHLAIVKEGIEAKWIIPIRSLTQLIKFLHKRLLLFFLLDIIHPF